MRVGRREGGAGVMLAAVASRAVRREGVGGGGAPDSGPVAGSWRSELEPLSLLRQTAELS